LETVSSVNYLGKRASLGNFMDITERKLAEEERERLIKELQGALEHINTLRGLLPICAWCKKLRDDQGYWRSVEDYISASTGAEFSHSICPECQDQFFNEAPTEEKEER